MKKYKMKICNICKKEFNPNSGAQKCCSKKCSNQNREIYYKKYNDDYYKKNKKQINEQHNQYYNNHKQESKEWHRDYYQDNKEKYKKLAINYYLLHKEELKNNYSHSKEYHNRYSINRRKNNINFKLSTYLRNRMWDALKLNRKSKTTMKLVGCSIDKLKQYLKSQFKPGMSWANYGKWHIDHIKPCVSFDLSKPKEQRKCFHYTNLQPLWAKENQSKGSKV